MRTFDKAWRLVISKKNCSFCDNPAFEYEKFKYYCEECWNKLKGIENGDTKSNRTSDLTDRKVRRKQS